METSATYIADNQNLLKDHDAVFTTPFTRYYYMIITPINIRFDVVNFLPFLFFLLPPCILFFLVSCLLPFSSVSRPPPPPFLSPSILILSSPFSSSPFPVFSPSRSRGNYWVIAFTLLICYPEVSRKFPVDIG